MSDEIRDLEMRGLKEDVSVANLPETGRIVETAPTKEPQSPAEWVRYNLFSGPVNSILTVIAGALLLIIIYQAFGFLFLNSDWRVIQVRMKGYMVGGFPLDEVWRVWVSIYLLAALAGFSAGPTIRRTTRRGALIAVLAALVAATIVTYTAQSGLVRLLAAAVPGVFFVAAFGGRLVPFRVMRKARLWGWILIFPMVMFVIRGLDGVPPREWGGLFFNLVAASVGIFASFPIGIALALGRRSTLPAVRGFSIVVIEIFRGVPLVAWLIFSKFVVDLLLPPQMNLPDIIKAFVVMTMFSAAYIAEIIRGGIQGVHSGQYEAARALGLPTSRMMAFIVLPQALRATIPAMIGHFISLFKDTALFAAIQVTELLDASTRLGLEFIGQDAQTLVFAGFVFWVIAFSMSRWSQRLEIRLGVGER